MLGPSQTLPPYRGAGLSHFLSDSCSPSPQETEHGLNGDHAPQLPSSAETANKSSDNLIILTFFGSHHELVPLSPAQLGSSLQCCTCKASPGQLLPGGDVLSDGMGLEQARCRTLEGTMTSPSDLAMHVAEQ